MKINSLFKFVSISCVVLTMQACHKSSLTEFTTAVLPSAESSKSILNFPETFESASKTTYTTANVTLTSGSWNFTDAMLGTSNSDRKFNTKSVRIQNTGRLTMNFNVTVGVSAVSFYHARYASEASSTLELWASTDNGTTWTKEGNTISVSSTTLTLVTIPVNFTSAVRFQIRKISGGRLNIDNLDIQDFAPAPTRDNNMALGNPSNATTDVVNTNNYLMVKSQFALSYNNARGQANWVSWHLSPAWKGPAARCDCFTSDNSLPSSFFKATTSNYTGTGFDRGHMCPSDDRDANSTDNAATFLMTNIMPQAPNLNQITWLGLENYCRTLMNAGNELYIISGGIGNGGTGSNGGLTTTIGSGKIAVPSHCWKVVVAIPDGANDLSRINSSTRVIAVNMPNVQTVNSQPWGNYRISVDALESLTGYNFNSNVSDSIQAIIEAAPDNGPTQ